MNANLKQHRRDLEHRQYAFEAAISKEIAEFKAEVRMYMKNNDERMRRFEEDSKKRDEQYHSLVWNATITWAVGIISVIIAIFATRP